MFPHYLVMARVVKNEKKNDHRCLATFIWWWVEFVILKKNENNVLHPFVWGWEFYFT
jgi:hypothetical protein